MCHVSLYKYYFASELSQRRLLGCSLKPFTNTPPQDFLLSVNGPNHSFSHSSVADQSEWEQHLAHTLCVITDYSFIVCLRRTYLKKRVTMSVPYQVGGVALSKVLNWLCLQEEEAKLLNILHIHTCMCVHVCMCVCIWMMDDDLGWQHVELTERDPPPSFIDKSYTAAAAHDDGVGCSSGSLQARLAKGELLSKPDDRMMSLYFPPTRPISISLHGLRHVDPTLVNLIGLR